MGKAIKGELEERIERLSFRARRGSGAYYSGDRNLSSYAQEDMEDLEDTESGLQYLESLQRICRDADSEPQLVLLTAYRLTDFVDIMEAHGLLVIGDGLLRTVKAVSDSRKVVTLTPNEKYPEPIDLTDEGMDKLLLLVGRAVFGDRRDGPPELAQLL